MMKDGFVPRSGSCHHRPRLASPRLFLPVGRYGTPSVVHVAHVPPASRALAKTPRPVNFEDSDAEEDEDEAFLPEEAIVDRRIRCPLAVFNEASATPRRLRLIAFPNILPLKNNCERTGCPGVVLALCWRAGA